jgi:hypothetical protein
VKNSVFREWASGTTRFDQTKARLVLLQIKTQRYILTHVDLCEFHSNPPASSYKKIVRDDRSGVDIFPPSGASWHSRFAIPAQGSSTIMHLQFSKVKKYVETSHKNATKCDTNRCVAPIEPSLSSSLIHPPPSPSPSPPSPPPPPEAAPPPPHDRRSQRNAAACVHTAARGSGQAGTPSLVASACAPSRTRPSRTEPPLDRAWRHLQLHAPDTPEKCSGVSAFCSEWQWSGRHLHSRHRCVCLPPHLRPPLYHTSTVPPSINVQAHSAPRLANFRLNFANLYNSTGNALADKEVQMLRCAQKMWHWSLTLV